MLKENQELPVCEEFERNQNWLPRRWFCLPKSPGPGQNPWCGRRGWLPADHDHGPVRDVDLTGQSRRSTGRHVGCQKQSNKRCFSPAETPGREFLAVHLFFFFTLLTLKNGVTHWLKNQVQMMAPLAQECSRTISRALVGGGCLMIGGVKPSATQSASQVKPSSFTSEMSPRTSLQI